MLEQIIEFDKELFLTLNGCYNDFFDILMPAVSNKFTGIPIYVGILSLICYIWIGHGVKSAAIICIVVVAVLLTFALCDSLSVHLIKNNVNRLRPAWDPEIGDLVRLLENKGGKHGFVSTHAANLFGLATITSIFVRKRWYTWFIFIWAVLVGYSRIYVGKHYPLDVVCGALFGIIIGLMVVFVTARLWKRYNLDVLYYRRK